MKRIVILRGLPGAGKTRYIDDLVEKGEQIVVCSADHFFERRVGGRSEYLFDPKLLPEAHSVCFSAFLDALLAGYPLIVVDNTNIRRWEYTNYDRAARLAGYEVEIVEVRVDTFDDVRVCASRGTHGVPKDIIAKMAVDFEPDTRAKIVQIKR